MTSRRFLLPIAAIALAMLTLVGCDGAIGWQAAPTATPQAVTTPEGAVAAVVAHEPRLTGIGPLDPDLIGQANWYEVTPASGVGAFLVTIRIGWGDCPAGCINEHRWVYAVQPDGSVVTQSETGDVVPPDAWPSPDGDGRAGLRITATAGPTCPVETNPPDPACAARPVPDAVVIIRDGGGTEVARGTLDAQGFAFIALPEGDYVVEAQPVDGLMGPPAPLPATISDGMATAVDLAYDTGIR